MPVGPAPTRGQRAAPTRGQRAAIDALVEAMLARRPLALLEGEASIGKTLVLDAACAELRGTGLSVLRAEGVALRPAALLQRLGVMGAALAAAGAGAAADGAAERLPELVGERVLALDDAHALPPETLALLAVLLRLRADGGRALQVLLVGATGLLQRLGAAAPELRERAGSPLGIAPMQAEEAASFLAGRLQAHRLGADALPARAARALLLRAGGVPARLDEELARVLAPPAPAVPGPAAPGSAAPGSAAPRSAALGLAALGSAAFMPSSQGPWPPSRALPASLRPVEHRPLAGRGTLPGWAVRRGGAPGAAGPGLPDLGGFGLGGSRLGLAGLGFAAGMVVMAGLGGVAWLCWPAGSGPAAGTGAALPGTAARPLALSPWAAPLRAPDAGSAGAAGPGGAAVGGGDTPAGLRSVQGGAAGGVSGDSAGEAGAGAPAGVPSGLASGPPPGPSAGLATASGAGPASAAGPGSVSAPQTGLPSGPGLASAQAAASGPGPAASPEAGPAAASALAWGAGASPGGAPGAPWWATLPTPSRPRDEGLTQELSGSAQATSLDRGADAAPPAAAAPEPTGPGAASPDVPSQAVASAPPQGPASGAGAAGMGAADFGPAPQSRDASAAVAPGRVGPLPVAPTPASAPPGVASLADALPGAPVPDPAPVAAPAGSAAPAPLVASPAAAPLVASTAAAPPGLVPSATASSGPSTPEVAAPVAAGLAAPAPAPLIASAPPMPVPPVAPSSEPGPPAPASRRYAENGIHLAWPRAQLPSPGAEPPGDAPDAEAPARHSLPRTAMVPHQVLPGGETVASLLLHSLGRDDERARALFAALNPEHVASQVLPAGTVVLLPVRDGADRLASGRAERWRRPEPLPRPSVRPYFCDAIRPLNPAEIAYAAEVCR